MTTFLNQKEEVLRIELTPYGKEKFSKGEFSPKYYAFYDNDILYDAEHAGIAETQNNRATRILTKTPRLGPLTSFTSSTSPVVTLRSLDNANNFVQSTAYSAPFNRYIGDSSPWSDFVPSWHIMIDNLSDVSLSGTTNYRMNNTIPVVTASLNLEYGLEDISLPEADPNIMFLLEKADNITLDIQELNTLFKLRGNFDLEIYKVDDSGRIEALGFINPNSKNSENLFYQAEAGTLSNTIEGTDEEIIRAFPMLDNTYVEYYFEVLVDSEIPGVQMPTHTTVYRQNINRTPTNLCSVVDEIGSAQDWGF